MITEKHAGCNTLAPFPPDLSLSSALDSLIAEEDQADFDAQQAEQAMRQAQLRASLARRRRHALEAAIFGGSEARP